MLLGIVYLVVRRQKERNTVKKPPTNIIVENPSAGYTSKLLSDASKIIFPHPPFV